MLMSRCNFWTRLGGVLLVGAISMQASGVEDPKPRVEVEESVTPYLTEGRELSHWCLWGYGAPHLVRFGQEVFVSLIDTNSGLEPLCNNRWLLWRRGADGWRIVQQGDKYIEFQPCPLGVLADGRLLLSVNPHERPGGKGRCHPQILQLSASDMTAEPRILQPAWPEDAEFLEHTYRGLGVDAATGEILLLSLLQEEEVYCANFADSSGQWRDLGRMRFPIRACYPQVVLRNRTAHVLAIGDIHEPVKAYRELKGGKEGRFPGFVFRRLFYTFNPDVRHCVFGPALEVDSVEDSGGDIDNLDLHVDALGQVHVLYLRHPYTDELIRQRFFPDKRPTSQLIEAVIDSGRVVSRQVLLDQDAPIAEGPMAGRKLVPGFARYHLTPQGDLWTILYASGSGEEDMYLLRLAPAPTGSLIPLGMKHPLSRFFTNTVRGGSAPSSTIDLFGGDQRSSPSQLRYARVVLP